MRAAPFPLAKMPTDLRPLHDRAGCQDPDLLSVPGREEGLPDDCKGATA